MTSSYQSIRLRFLFIPHEKCILYLKINIISTWHHRVKVYDLRVYVSLIVRSQCTCISISSYNLDLRCSTYNLLYNGVRPSMTLFSRFVVRRTPTIARNRRWCRPHDRRCTLNDVGRDVRWDPRTRRSYTLIRWYRGLEITFFLGI